MAISRQLLFLPQHAGGLMPSTLRSAAYCKTLAGFFVEVFPTLHTHSTYTAIPIFRRISLMSKSGKLAEKGEYCVLFSRTNGGKPTQVQSVFVEVAQQVGKITERPERSSLSLDNLGRYCGEINLGKQYYRPAFYYVEVYYTDRLGKRRKCRFFLTLK